jgi:hypothetical protein
MADPTGFFVQFPHPGGEHNPSGNDMPWNTGEHRRKFLVTPGRCLDGDERICEAELVFWAEWEPPSRVERRWPAAAGGLPRALHRPYWVEPLTRGFRQNTDPWVWGDRMIYSNCRQTVRPERRPNSMQRLIRGSVVCFGSTIEGEFCVDTVFVVAGAEPWGPAEVEDLDVDRAFKTCTGGSIMTGKKGADWRLTLYRGATVDDPVEGMFSFVPARRADVGYARFARPPVRLPGMVNPANWRSTWGSRRPLPIGTLRDSWEAVRHQVLAANLLLAVWLQTPYRQGGDAAVPGTARHRC